MKQKIIQLIAGVLLPGMLFVITVAAQESGKPELQSKVAAVKEAAAKNQAALHQYQWVETTQISLKGEVKSTKQSSCVYGNDGKVLKTPIETAPQPDKSSRRNSRLKQRVIEHKKDEMSDYMEQVKSLIDLYVPPDPNRMQTAFQAGNVSQDSTSTPGATALVFKSYVQPNDSLSLAFLAEQKKLTTLNVNTYLNDPKDVVTLAVQFATLPDGTSYPGQVVLVATAKQIQITVSNGNYRKK